MRPVLGFSFYLEHSWSSVKLCILAVNSQQTQSWDKLHTSFMHTKCVFDGLQHASQHFYNRVYNMAQFWRPFSKMIQTAATYDDVFNSTINLEPDMLSFSMCVRIDIKNTCWVDAHTVIQMQYIKNADKKLQKILYAHVCIMQIAVTPVSVITKVCGGYNRGMLSAVKSCGQSETTQGHLCFVVSLLWEIPCCQPITQLQEHTDEMKSEIQKCCFSALMILISVMEFFSCPRSQILTHCCWSPDCNSLFLPHPHLSVRDTYSLSVHKVQLAVQTGLIDMIH